MGAYRRVVSAAALAAFAVGTSATGYAATGPINDPLYTTGPSDADYVVVASGQYKPNPGDVQWYDHTDLTVAVNAGQGAPAGAVAAIHRAIATWRQVLAQRLPVVSLADITDAVKNHATADIELNYVRSAFGWHFGAITHCGGQSRCTNVKLKSEFPDGRPLSDFDDVRLYRETLHEIGHALGLGHAFPLNQSIDLMAYGWSPPLIQVGGTWVYQDVPPILSDCDIAGIAATFAWALNGERPHPATVASVTC